MSTKEYRSTSFMHSDAEDVAEKAVNDSMDYAPSVRAFFLRMVIGKIADEIQKMEPEKQQTQP